MWEVEGGGRREGRGREEGGGEGEGGGWEGLLPSLRNQEGRHEILPCLLTCIIITTCIKCN